MSVQKETETKQEKDWWRDRKTGEASIIENNTSVNILFKQRGKEIDIDKAMEATLQNFVRLSMVDAVSWIYWKFVLLYLGSIVCFPITTCCRLLIKLPSYLTVIITNSLSYGIFADAVWKCYFYSIELNFNPNKCHFLLKAVIAVR